MDRSKLIKFLNLSASTNDSEALSAIRKAHIFLEENETSWTELFDKNIIKENKEDYVILHMNLLKERANSQDLENKIRGFKNIIYLLSALIVIVVLIVFLK